MTTSYAHLPLGLPAKPMQELPGRRHRWDVGPGAFLGPGAFPAPGGAVRPNDLSETDFEDDVEDGPEIISSKDCTDDESDDDSGSDSDCDSDEEDVSTPHPATVKQHPTFPPTHHHPAPAPAVHVQPRMQPRGGSPEAPPLSPHMIQQIEQVVINTVPGVVKQLNGAPAGPEPRGSGLNIETKNGRYPSLPSSTYTELGFAPPPPPQRPVYQNHGPSVSGPAKVIPPGVLTPSSSPQPSPTSASQQPQVYRSNSGAVVQPRSGPPSPSSQRGPVRFTDRGHPVLKGDGSGGSTGGSSPVELSAVDQKWGVLFNQRGEPTERVENVFRGVARYLVDELEPPNSIVVTPQKMYEYYKRHAVSNEPASFAWLFRSSTPASYSALSELYQALGADHHLVPAGRGECPAVPGLTPDGFVTWCTATVLAHPDEEAARLQSVFQSWPVNCDGPKGLGNSERLPKMLSRHLLPAKHVESRRAMFQGAVQKFRDTIRQANSAGRITSSVLRAERRVSIAPGNGSAQMAGTNSRPSRYSDDEIMRKPPVSFKDPVYVVSGRSQRTRRFSHGHVTSNASARGGSPKRFRNGSLPSPRSTSGSIGSSSTGSADPARRNSTRDRSPSQSKSYHRHSKADGSYGSSTSYDKAMSSGTTVYPSSSRHGGERKYHGGSRERDRERERERERERDRDRDRDRDHEKKRDRTRERERERDRNRDRDRDTENRLSSRRRSELDETPRRRSTDKDPRGPTWGEMSSGKQGFIALLKSVTKELDS